MLFSRNQKIDLKRISSLIIRCPNWIGDAVMATSFLKDIRNLFPSSKIIGTSHPAIGELYHKSPFFDEFISVSRKKEDKKAENQKFIATLQEIKPDLGILLTGSFSSAWSFFRGKIPLRVGFDGHMRKFLLTHSVSRNSASKTNLLHDVEKYRLLLKPLQEGVSEQRTTTIPPPSLSLYVDEDEIQEIEDFLENGYSIYRTYHRIIIINPGAAYGSAKCWPIASFRKLIQQLILNPENRVLLIGDHSMKEIGDDIIQDLPQRVYNLSGKTSLRQLMALISISHGVVSNDSGPMHIASACNKPVVALFGSTNPFRTGPFHGGIILYKKASCSPCYLRKCPIDFRCMTSLSVHEVYNALMQIMEKKDE